LLIVISSALSLAGQEPPGNPSGRTAAAPDRLFSQVVLRLQDGRYVTGLLLGFEDEGIVLRVGEAEVKTRRSDLALVTVARERKTGGFALNGIVLGLIGGNLFQRHTYDGPTGFVGYETVWSALFDNALYAGAGGTLGYLISLIADSKETTFDFSGRDIRASAAWDALKAFALSSERPGSGPWRLTVHSAYVFAGASRRYRDLFEAAGYAAGNGYYESSQGADVNVVRRIGLSRAVGRRFEIGISAMFLGERSSSAWKEGPWFYAYIGQSLSGTGFFLTGSWAVLGSGDSDGPRWKIGLGAGGVKVDVGLSGWTDDYSQYGPSTYWSEEKSVSKTVAAGLAFTEIDVLLYGGLRLGITADYALTPPIPLPGLPAAGVPDRKAAFGNGSVGIGFTWIF
jgi:hypothetical protein